MFALTSRPCLTTQFFPVRRKRSETPRSLWLPYHCRNGGQFRQLRQKSETPQSLAFVDGVPIFERYFLGDEFSIRGYNVRSISPLAPLDTFITSQNVVIASNPAGTPTPVPGRSVNLGQHRYCLPVRSAQMSHNCRAPILRLAPILSCWATSNIAFQSSATRSAWRVLPTLARPSTCEAKKTSSFRAPSLTTNPSCKLSAPSGVIRRQAGLPQSVCHRWRPATPIIPISLSSDRWISGAGDAR